VAVLDLVVKEPTRFLWSRVIEPNLASIMPQAVAVWCEEAGHDVRFVCYTGGEDLAAEIPEDVDVLFIASFTHAAQLAYALSQRYRQHGAVTVLGGPHARCYPEDAVQYFDYVLGFTDKALILDVLRDCAPQRPLGLRLSAKKQPTDLPGAEQRWKFIAPTLAKTPVLKAVPMLSSLGCPYTCSFCVDSVVDYQPLDHRQLQDDLRFLRTKFKRPCVAWHDPNFGVRFEETLGAIEEAVPPGSIDFLAESSLSLLSEPRLVTMRRNGFKAILPGIESWYAMGNKSKTGHNVGLDKVNQVSDHVNTIMRYIPYVQTNFVLGLDDDEGAEPFELTKLFVDKTPGAFPAYSLLSAFGQAAPLNLELQRDGRVLGVPFHFLDNNHAMNVKPKNYSWTQLYDHVIDLRRHSFSWRAIGRRLGANRGGLPRSLNLLRAVSSEGFGRIHHDSLVRKRLETDAPLRRFFEGETTAVPTFYSDQVKRDLGDFWSFLPSGAMSHDPNAYLKAHGTQGVRLEKRAAAGGSPQPRDGTTGRL
jgi:hypothetical protein